MSLRQTSKFGHISLYGSWTVASQVDKAQSEKALSRGCLGARFTPFGVCRHTILSNIFGPPYMEDGMAL